MTCVLQAAKNTPRKQFSKPRSPQPKKPATAKNLKTTAAKKPALKKSQKAKKPAAKKRLQKSHKKKAKTGGKARAKARLAPPELGCSSPSVVFTGFSAKLAVRNDELNKLLGGVTIAQGGVLPNIQAVLLPKKTEKPAKTK
ncbi:histone H2A.2.1-like [Cyprinus carpio]|uniref:Histone H2A.2.1-like n=1 Tax=Cyprinus carpio TaxID=7962 RepID=A0A9R0AZV3_CYPCA|nr:histone H2A.2.1-like [Cyprinus carpio]